MSETERLTEIRQNLIATFDEGDLRTLCFDLSVAFSPDGRTRASGSDDGTVTVRDIDPASWMRRACGIANRNLTQAEWQRYMGDEPYRKTCPDAPAGS